MKQSKVGKAAFWIIYILLFAAVGAVAGWHGALNSISGILLLLCALLLLALVLDAIYKKLWPKAEASPKENKLKLIVRTALQLAMGFTFAYGVMNIIVMLIDGYEYGFGLYIGFIVLSIAILFVLIAVPAIQNQQIKDELAEAKQELKIYHKDERLAVISEKAGYYTLGVTLMLILVFGALITIFPPNNFNVIPVGILGIFGLACIFYCVLFSLYDSGKIDIEKKRTLTGVSITFIISLVPPILMGVYWIKVGLSSIGIAFFAMFVMVAAYAALNLWFEKRYK
jgi:MFS family permease